MVTSIPDIDELEDLWTAKLATVEGVRSAFSIGQLEELESERIFKAPAAMVMHTGAPTDEPRTWDVITQEGRIDWSIFVVAESMRGRRMGRKGEAGANRISKLILEAVIGWEIKDGWPVYLVDWRPYDVGEASQAIIELLLAHPYDLVGN